MIGSVKSRRVVGLLLLAIAATLLVSVALGTPEAEAKKKINVVICSSTDFFCEGTEGRDRLVGTSSPDEIFGDEGNDVYEGKGGSDLLNDFSTTSNDTYTGYEPGFGNDTIRDFGGNADFLDLGSLRLADDVSLIRQGDDLVLDGPGVDNVTIRNHFRDGRIEKIKFANVTLTGKQTENLAREAAPEERPPEE